MVNSPDRADIARFALRTAHDRHGPDALEAVYVIGDTEHDIACGKCIGARTVAVGTGPFSAAQLLAHEPWWAIDELPGAQEFFARVCA